MRLIDADALVETMKADEPEVWIQDEEYLVGLRDQYLLDLTAVEAAPTVHLLRSMATYGPPKDVGWYLVYAPNYTGGSSKEHINGYMFAQWNGKTWSVERYGYQQKSCVKAWMALPDLTNGVMPGCGAKMEGEVG